MLRYLLLCLILVATVPQTVVAQDEVTFRQRILTPFKGLRENVLLSSETRPCPICKIRGKVCPKCAAKKAEKLAALKGDKALEAKEKELAAKRQELEEKQIALEEKQIAVAEEELAEEHKPWDVADPENLDSDSPLLAKAAASKQHQELAPKKIDALNYLATLGCVLDPSVQDALMAGLQDFNEEVRAAAVQAVISSYRGVVTPYPGGLPPKPAPWEKGEEGEEAMDAAPPSPYQNVSMTYPSPGLEHQQACSDCQHCRNKRSFQKLFQRNCMHCEGGGCDGCNYCGQVTEVYSEPCEVCQPEQCETCFTCANSCKRCCTPNILKQLKKMAEGRDAEKDDCFFEPSEKVRMMAMEALALCPGIPEKKEDPAPPVEEEPEIGETADSEEEEEEEPEIGETADDIDDFDEDDAADGPTLDPEPEMDDDDADSPSDEDETPSPFGIDLEVDEDAETGINRDSSFQSVSFRSQNSNMLPARAAKPYGANGFLVKVPADYLIPKGSQVFLQSQNGQSQVADVTESRAGLMAIEIANNESPVFVNGEDLQVGVIR